jgi:hypothetical protein
MLTYLQYEPGILINIYNLPSNFTGYVSRECLQVATNVSPVLTCPCSRSQGLEWMKWIARITVARWHSSAIENLSCLMYFCVLQRITSISLCNYIPSSTAPHSDCD